MRLSTDSTCHTPPKYGEQSLDPHMVAVAFTCDTRTQRWRQTIPRTSWLATLAMLDSSGSNH